ncbi:transposase domain-containing protein [Sinorhizobium meliloti]|nr:transposase domain-containing protein [Sinorhizobium meliloti]
MASIPRAYLADVLERIHDHHINWLDQLLPWNWSPIAVLCAEVA